MRIPRREQEKIEQQLYPLGDMVIDMLSLSEDEWGMYAFSREPLEGKFRTEQKLDYIRKSCECGELEAAILQDHYGTLSLTEIAKRLELTVENPNVPNGGNHVIFAQYTEPAKIEIFMDAVKKANELFREEKIHGLLEQVDIYNLLFAHELFHGVEYQKRRSIYTQTEKVELWRRPFSNKSRIIALGEIAGMAFAKRMLGISYSPYIFDVILMYAYNKEAACMLYENVMEIHKEFAATYIQEKEKVC